MQSQPQERKVKMVDQKDQNSAGNDSRDNIETVVFEGHTMLLNQDENGEYQIDPQDAPQDVIDKLNNGEANKLLASLNKKNFTFNREREELELRRKELELREKEIELKRKENTPSKPEQTSKEKTYDDYLIEVFGTSDNDQLALMQAENPKLYIQNTAKVARLMSGAVSFADLQSIQQQSLIDSQIVSQGYDPIAVEEFMRGSSIMDKRSAFELYKRLNDKPTASTPQNLRSSVQESSPRVLTPGTIRPTANPTQKAKDYLLNLANKV